MRPGARALVGLLAAIESGCVSMNMDLPRVVSTDALVPHASAGEPRDPQFALRFEAVIDERPNRSSVGYHETLQGQTPIVADRDISEVFRSVIARALERKGVVEGPSPWTLRAAVRQAVVSSYMGMPVEAAVAVDLSVVDARRSAKLWTRTYAGKASGRAHQATLAAAFRDLAGDLGRDQSLLELKPAFAAAGLRACGRHRALPVAARGSVCGARRLGVQTLRPGYPGSA